MRIQLKEISDASRCLRYYNFLQTVKLPSRNTEAKIAEQVIKKSYLIALESGYRADWRRVVGWVDSAVFQDVELSENKAFEEAKLMSEHILKFVSSWYHKYYMVEDVPVYTEVPLEGTLGRNVIAGTAPIVKLKENPVVTICTDIATTPIDLYNQIEIRGLQWLLSESLEQPLVQVECYQFGPRGGFEVSTSYATTPDHDRTKEMINQVGSLIAAKFDYPSYTDMCNTCPFKARCKI